MGFYPYICTQIYKHYIMVTERILIVDDESRMRKLIKDFLIQKNFSILEAEDGEKAFPF